jgi:hypothetical protein
LRLALAGGQVGSTNGCCAISDQRRNLWLIKIVAISGRAFMSRFSSAELSMPTSAVIQASARWNAELLLPAKMAIPPVWQIGSTCRKRQQFCSIEGFRKFRNCPRFVSQSAGRKFETPAFKSWGAETQRISSLLPSGVASATTRLMAQISQPTDPAATLARCPSSQRDCHSSQNSPRRVGRSHA